MILLGNSAHATMRWAIPVAAEPAPMKRIFWSLGAGTPLILGAQAAAAAASRSTKAVSIDKVGLTEDLLDSLD